MMAGPSAQVISPAQASEIDAVSLVKRIRRGEAALLRGRPVSGTGYDFRGPAPAGGRGANATAELVLTVGALSNDGGTMPITRIDDWNTAMESGRVLEVILRSSKPGFRPPTSVPGPFRFQGQFTGTLDILLRPHGNRASSNPCTHRVGYLGHESRLWSVYPAEPRVDCVPVLTEVTISVPGSSES